MKAEENRLEQNDLVRWITIFWTKLKSGQIIGPKTLGVLLLAGLAIGLWSWFSGQSRKGGIATLAGPEHGGGESGLPVRD